MELKCRNEIFELNEKDVIMFNGSCYQLITRKAGHGWETYTPIVAKSKALKLIKQGSLILFKEKKGEKFDLLYYKINGGGKGE